MKNWISETCFSIRKLISKRVLGIHGETLACHYLEEKDHEILKRNFRTRTGEVDIISIKDEILTFTEVKTRQGSGHFNPLDFFPDRKIEAIPVLVKSYLKKEGVKGRILAVNLIILEIVQWEFHYLEGILDISCTCNKLW